MKYKKILVFVCICVFLINFFSIAFGEGDVEKEPDWVKRATFKNVDIEKLGNDRKITFKSENSVFGIGGVMYGDGTIKPADALTSSWLIIDKDGRIKDGDFVVDKFKKGSGGIELLGNKFIFGKDSIYILPDTRVIVKDYVIKIYPPKDSTYVMLPEQLDGMGFKYNFDFVAVNDKVSLYTLKYDEARRNFVLSNGVVRYYDGKVYLVAKGLESKSDLPSEAKINNVVVSNVRSNEDLKIRLFSDGKKQEKVNEDYISLNSENKLFYAVGSEKSKSSFDISFEKENAFLRVEEGDLFKISKEKEAGVELSIKNDGDMVSSVNFAKGSFVNGGYRFTRRGADVIVEPIKEQINKNTPVAVVVEKVKRNQALLIENDGGYKMLPMYSDELDRLSSIDFQYGQEFLEMFEKKYPDVKWKGTGHITSRSDAEKILNEFESLPPILKSSVEGITFHEELLFGGIIIAAGVTGDKGDNVIHVNVGDKDLIKEESILHEAVHVFHKKKEKELDDLNEETKKALKERFSKEVERFNKEWVEYMTKKTGKPAEEILLVHKDGFNFVEDKKELKNLDELYNPGSLMNAPGAVGTQKEYYETFDKELRKDFFKEGKKIQELAKQYNEAYLERKKSGFNDEWYAIQEPKSFMSEKEYEKAKESGEPDAFNKWKDGSKEPRNGFIAPYGRIDVKEDVASFSEIAWSKDGFVAFKELINPKSKKYDERYRKKLEFLKKYGLLDEERFKAILDSAGVKMLLVFLRVFDFGY